MADTLTTVDVITVRLVRGLYQRMSTATNVSTVVAAANAMKMIMGMVSMTADVCFRCKRHLNNCKCTTADVGRSGADVRVPTNDKWDNFYRTLYGRSNLRPSLEHLLRPPYEVRLARDSTIPHFRISANRITDANKAAALEWLVSQYREEYGEEE